MGDGVVEQIRMWQTPEVQGQLSRLEYWTELVGQTLFGVSIDPLHTEQFVGRLERRRYGSADLFRVEVSGQRLHRTRRDIARDACDDVILNMMISGGLRLRQFGRDEIARPGDSFLSDCSECFDYQSADTIRSLTLRLPRATLVRQIPDIEASIGRRIERKQPWGRALRSYVAALADDEPSDLIPPSLLIEQAVSMIRMALGPSPAGTSSHQAATLVRARTVLRERWNEEGLTPGDVALDVGISRNHLHSLFAKAGTTFSRELEHLRIEQAAALLGPIGRRLTVSEIAFRCGFSSAAHFSRKFRMARGVPPTDYRLQAAGSA